MSRRDMSEVSKPVRIGTIVAGLVQVAFAALAFWDLANRPAKAVNGPKVAWIPVIFVNWIGPAAYFLFGQKR